jgi:hypothetical protein
MRVFAGILPQIDLGTSVVMGQSTKPDILQGFDAQPQALTTTVSPGHEGISMTYRKR